MQTNNYLSIVGRDSSLRDFYIASQYCLTCKPDRIKSFELSTLYETSVTAVGPILTAYIYWVLSSAKKDAHKTLYFLARDGKIMYEIAQILNDYFHFGLELRYLYVSRLSLRKALYFLDKLEAIQIICKDGLHISPAIVLMRTALPEYQQEKLLKELGFSSDSQHQPLSAEGLRRLQYQLSNNVLFDELMTSFSEEQLNIIRKYLIQEGLTEKSSFALVDSGWTGSMQHTICKILKSTSKCNITISGYYFGIQNLTAPEDGIYNCFYFTGKKKDSLRYIWFNNNLFEAWCMANHGMTIGYEATTTKIIPVTKPYSIIWYENEQMDFVLQYARCWCSNFSGSFTPPIEELSRHIKPLIVRAITHPSRAEANVYGKIPFCDDSTESYLMPLAKTLSGKDLINNLLLFRIYHKYFSHSYKREFSESYWKEGTFALLPVLPAFFLKLDNVIFHFLKMIISFLK